MKNRLLYLAAIITTANTLKRRNFRTLEEARGWAIKTADLAYRIYRLEPFEVIEICEYV